MATADLAPLPDWDVFRQISLPCSASSQLLAALSSYPSSFPPLFLSLSWHLCPRPRSGAPLLPIDRRCSLLNYIQRREMVIWQCGKARKCLFNDSRKRNEPLTIAIYTWKATDSSSIVSIARHIWLQGQPNSMAPNKGRFICYCCCCRLQCKLQIIISKRPLNGTLCL